MKAGKIEIEISTEQLQFYAEQARVAGVDISDVIADDLERLAAIRSRLDGEDTH